MTVRKSERSPIHSVIFCFYAESREEGAQIAVSAGVFGTETELQTMVETDTGDSNTSSETHGKRKQETKDKRWRFKGRHDIMPVYIKEMQGPDSTEYLRAIKSGNDVSEPR